MIALFFTGCIPVYLSEPPVSPEEPENIQVTTYLDEYRIRVGDILEIIYEIHPLKTDEYRLDIQDVVEVRFLSMPELNYPQTIRPDGRITLPYIGDIEVLNSTSAQATRRIRSAYENILRFPDVFLVIKEFGAGTKELKEVIKTSSRGQSKLLTVRPDGRATFPMIGEMFVAEETVPNLSSQVNESYKKLYRGLHVDVILSKTSGIFVYILGEVENPGAYEIKRPVTVIEALAMAGGPTVSAKLRHVALSQRDGPDMISRIVDMEARLNGKRKMIAGLLKPDAIVYVPKRPLATAAQIAKEISQVTFFRGFSIGGSWKLED